MLKALVLQPEKAEEALALATQLAAVAEQQAALTRELLASIDLTGEIETVCLRDLVVNQQQIRRIRTALKSLSETTAA